MSLCPQDVPDPHPPAAVRSPLSALIPFAAGWAPVLTVCLGLFLATARAEPDESLLGKAEGYPQGTPAKMFAERFKVGSFSHSGEILPTRIVARGGPVAPLPRAPEVTITYRFRRALFTPADYLEHQRVTGLLVLKDGRIVAEHYRYGRSEHDRFLSFSMSKSVGSLLIGVACEKGLIALDEPAQKYVPELKGAGYGQATIRQLLRMSSGVKFVEDYSGKDDLARLGRAERGLASETPLEVLASFSERVFPAGEKLGYASAESAVLGYVLARATGRNLATLACQWLWQPLGAEADAAYNYAVDGQEQLEGRFNATLRDYARLGLLLMNDGVVQGRQIVPRDYLLDATDAARQPPAFHPRVASPYYGYGYQFWIFPMRSRTFGMLGIFGQCVFVQPSSRIVMVQTAVYKDARDSAANAERDALWRGILASLGGDAREK